MPTSGKLGSDTDSAEAFALSRQRSRGGSRPQQSSPRSAVTDENALLCCSLRERDGLKTWNTARAVRRRGVVEEGDSDEPYEEDRHWCRKTIQLVGKTKQRLGSPYSSSGPKTVALSNTALSGSFGGRVLENEASVSTSNNGGNRKGAFWHEVGSLREENELLRREAQIYFLKSKNSICQFTDSQHRLTQSSVNCTSHLVFFFTTLPLVSDNSKPSVVKCSGCQSAQLDSAVQVILDDAYKGAGQCLNEMFDVPVILLHKRISFPNVSSTFECINLVTQPTSTFQLVAISRAMAYIVGPTTNEEDPPPWIERLFDANSSLEELEEWLDYHSEFEVKNLASKKSELIIRLALKKRKLSYAESPTRGNSERVRGRMIFCPLLLGRELMIFGVHSSQLATSVFVDPNTRLLPGRVGSTLSSGLERHSLGNDSAEAIIMAAAAPAPSPLVQFSKRSKSLFIEKVSNTKLNAGDSESASDFKRDRLDSSPYSRPLKHNSTKRLKFKTLIDEAPPYQPIGEDNTAGSSSELALWKRLLKVISGVSEKLQAELQRPLIALATTRSFSTVNNSFESVF